MRLRFRSPCRIRRNARQRDRQVSFLWYGANLHRLLPRSRSRHVPPRLRSPLMIRSPFPSVPAPRSLLFPLRIRSPFPRSRSPAPPPLFPFCSGSALPVFRSRSRSIPDPLRTVPGSAFRSAPQLRSHLPVFARFPAILPRFTRSPCPSPFSPLQVVFDPFSARSRPFRSFIRSTSKLLFVSLLQFSLICAILLVQPRLIQKVRCPFHDDHLRPAPARPV